MQELCPLNSEDFYSFPYFFLMTIFVAINLVYHFVVKSYNFNSHFGVLDSYLQGLHILILEEFKNQFSVLSIVFFAALTVFWIFYLTSLPLAITLILALLL
jgi:hypothetical protein